MLPAVEVDVITEGGKGQGPASAGTSVGMHEAIVLVDNDLPPWKMLQAQQM